MTFNVAVPMGGYAGWKVLTRTMDTQKAAYAASAPVQTAEAYFKEKISSITSAEDLVSDYRLLSVALGAFGLGDDVKNKFFIQKVLSEGTTSDKAFSNRLSDKSYHALSKAFGFGAGEELQTTKAGFADGILEKYRTRTFEAAVGQQNEALRITMNAERTIPEMASATSSNNTKWYQVIGNKALATYMRGALGLPDAIGSLGVDQQLTIYKAKARASLGTDDFSQLGSAATMEKMTRNYLIRDQITNGTPTATSPALQILQGGNASANSILSLLL